MKSPSLMLNTNKKYLRTLLWLFCCASINSVLASESTNTATVIDDNEATVCRELTPSLLEAANANNVGHFAIDLPNGGLIWATEDPALIPPVMNVNATSLVAFDGEKIVEPVHFAIYTNYADFIKRMELVVYSGSDTDLLKPLTTIQINPQEASDVLWDGSLPPSAHLNEGDQLQYVLRAWSKDNALDETYAQTMQLVTPADRQRGLKQIREQANNDQKLLSDRELESALLTQNVYGLSNLRLQNITVSGSRVRVIGQNIPNGYSLTINDKMIPVDLERKFAAEYLMPVGKHELNVELTKNDNKKDTIAENLDVDVTGRYLFLTAIADATVSENGSSGPVEPVDNNDNYDDFLVDGRLGFYLKGKVKGKYLITAQADTEEQESGDLFTGFLKTTPQDIFRRLDPDAYYPVYGDDSTTTRDIDTQGKLYVRVDWDKNQALWGNYQTGLTGTEYAQYVRSLYGGALDWKSEETTTLGDPTQQLRVFGSQAQTALGHDDLLGTGGSVYYLRNTDVLPGSDQVTLEVRDNTTGRVESRVVLARGADYEIDEMQGRIILMRPLSQTATINSPTISHDYPTGEYDNILMVDYEYNVQGFGDEPTAGLRGKQWINDHIGLGATYVEEQRAGDNYTIKGVDMTLQAARGTYLKAEHAETESTVAPIFYSDNGGLNFTQLNSTAPGRNGGANSIEGRVNLQEQGFTDHEATVAGWDRNVSSGYSISRYDLSEAVHERGVEFIDQIHPDVALSGRVTNGVQGSDGLDQSSGRVDWQMTKKDELSGEVREVTETRNNVSGTGTLAATQYSHRFGDSLDVYGILQQTVDADSHYSNNDAATIGTKYAFGNLSSLGAEYTNGARGNATSVTADYQMTPDHSIYAGYVFSTDTTETEPLFNEAQPGGITLGQRWKMSDQVSMFNESQTLKTSNESGIAHTFGMDFYPGDNWNAGFTLQNGELQSDDGPVNRNAVSIRGGRTTETTKWSSTIEDRRDTGSQDEEQWATMHRVSYKLTPALTLAGRLNYAKTTNYDDSDQGAEFIESNLGFAWRPTDSTRWSAIGKYTYLYDLPAPDQVDSDYTTTYAQKSQVLALEATYRIDQYWELGSKVATRWGEAKENRNSGDWFDSQANFGALQGRYHIYEDWTGLVEYRAIDAKDGGLRQGWLTGVDRNVSENFRVGVGYNFTDFSDDLTNVGYTYQGWFLNMVGYY